MPGSSKTERQLGARAQQTRDRLYLFGRLAAYCSARVATEATVRRAATILLAAERTPFQVRIAEGTYAHQAVAIKPLIERGVRAIDVPLISIQITPIHPQFRAFRGIPAAGLLALERNAFASLDADLKQLYHGHMTIEAGADVVESVVATTAKFLPKPKPTDKRVQLVMALLREDPNYPFEKLAERAGLSYGGMSRLFSETIGISLRSYQLWERTYRALLLLPTGQSLTEIAYRSGFSDLAHFSRIFQQAFGAPLTYFMNPNYVEIFKHDQLIASSMQDGLLAPSKQPRTASR